MRPRTAALLLRLPLGPGSRRRHEALGTVLRAADRGAPAALRAVSEAVRSLGDEAVWRVWLRRSVSGPSSRRWASPVVAALSRDSVPVPDRVVDAAWGDWLAEHDATLWSLLERWDRPAAASDPGRCSLSLLALGDDAASVGPRVLVEAAVRLDHPIGERARARLPAAADAEAVDLFCATAVDVPDLAAFCVAHHLAPSDKVERAVFFVRTGQHEQHRALDPDGSLLALAYRAAAPELRERLRAVLAAAGDPEVIRVVVAGEQRDRIAELTDAELDYLGRQLAEHRRWDELRRLALDLPLARAVTAARLLPAAERTGATGTPLTALAAYPPERLRATLARLPRKRVIAYHYGRGEVRVSFSPDQSEFVEATSSMLVGTLRIGPGDGGPRMLRLDKGPYAGVRAALGRPVDAYSVLHLGDEIVRLRSDPAAGVCSISRVHPVYTRIAPEGPQIVSSMARVSTGAVAVTVSGLVFIDRGAVRRRDLPVPLLAEMIDASLHANMKGYTCQVATLPEAHLIAVSTAFRTLVLDEHGTVLGDRRFGVGRARWATFLTPDSLAVLAHRRGWKIWNLPVAAGLRHQAGRGWAGIEALRGSPLDAEFARALGSADYHGFLAGDPLTRPVPEALRKQSENRRLVAVSTYADMAVTSKDAYLELHSPFLSSVPKVLEAPLLHTTPRQWQQVRELRARIGDPEVREVLALLDACLAYRFDGDIELGAGPVSAGGPYDIALAEDRDQGDT
ncbi:MAG: hypothetical protein ACRDOO_09610 [Actinomadura sp.]